MSRISRAGVAFKTAPSSAGAKLSSVNDDGMTKFRTLGLVALEQFVFDDDAAAHARAESNEYGVGIIFTRTENRLAQSCHVCVVADF